MKCQVDTCRKKVIRNFGLRIFLLSILTSLGVVLVKVCFHFPFYVAAAKVPGTNERRTSNCFQCKHRTFKLERRSLFIAYTSPALML